MKAAVGRSRTPHGPGGRRFDLGDFDQATQYPHGLATTGGRATTTGVAGQTLGQRQRLAGTQAGPHPGQHGRRRAGHRRRRRGPGQRRREPGAALGPARWRRQLRGGHVLRVHVASRGSRRPRRDDDLPVGQGAVGAALLARLRRDRRGRVRQRPRHPHRPAGTIRARAPARDSSPSASSSVTPGRWTWAKEAVRPFRQLRSRGRPRRAHAVLGHSGDARRRHPARPAELLEDGERPRPARHRPRRDPG